jgi:5-methyltetrahydrofolate--homocysteine methyltransferase
MIEFAPARWERIREDARRWWAGELERPLVQMRLSGGDPGRPEPALPGRGFVPQYDADVPPEAIVDRWDYHLSGQRFLGDAFPTVWLNFGAGCLATFVGGELFADERTVWFRPAADREIADTRFRYDPDAPWPRRIMAVARAAAERWQGAVLVGTADIGGNLDVLSTFRPAEKLLLDLYDHPEEVKRLTWEEHEAWWRAFDDLNAILCPPNPGYTCWTSLFSETPYYMLQCDFAYMIGPAMFDAFVRPELAATCRRLGHAFYHLDGTGQLPHLDSLLAIEELDGIQWVPGAGEKPQAGWPDVYRRIHEAGKRIQIFDNARLETLAVLADALGTTRGIVVLATGAVGEEDEIRKQLEAFGIDV